MPGGSSSRGSASSTGTVTRSSRASFPSDPSAGSEGSEFMANTRSARNEITAAVTSWPGVHAVPGDLGELGFKLGRRDLHGDREAHFSFPKKLWAELRGQG